MLTFPAVILALAGPALSAPAPAPPPPRPLAEAASRVEASAKESDPLAAQRLAAAVVPDLRRQAALAEQPCTALLLLAEAELRAGLPGDARTTLERAKGARCHPAIVTHLEAWSLEYGEGRVRRGPGAPLRAAEDAYVRAAMLAPSLGEGADALAASALERSADLARLRGDLSACTVKLERVFLLALTQDTETRLALQYLDCAGAQVGEGAAIDRLHELLDANILANVAAARMAMLKERLDRGHDNAVALAAVAYHSFLARDQPQNLSYARRYLLQAAALDASLPDLWYLLGRINDELGQVEEARDNFRQQLRRHPGTPASRLAANDLAFLSATSPSSPSELGAALEIIDAEIAKTPDVAPFHDTRARVLAALGRRDDALAAWDRSLALAPDADVAAARSRLALAPASPSR